MTSTAWRRGGNHKTTRGTMPTIIGSGRYTLERVILMEYPNGFKPHKRNASVERIISEDVSGSCANVLCILANKGWTAMPHVSLYDCTDWCRIDHRLQYYGCDTRLLKVDHNGTIINNYRRHIYDCKTGKPIIKDLVFGLLGTEPEWEKLCNCDDVDTILEGIKAYPDVYYFDIDCMNTRRIASQHKKRGALVLYRELSKKPLIEHKDAVKTSDIVMFCSDYKKDKTFCQQYNDKLFIQTLNVDGVKFKLRDGEWVHLQPIEMGNIIDWNGYYDITTALFLRVLFRNGKPTVATLTEQEVIEALTHAMRKASKYSSYVSSKGGLEVW